MQNLENLQLLEQILDLIKKKAVSIENLSKETGIPTSRIYSWNNKRAKPKGEDFVKLQNWVTKFAQILTTNTLNEPQPYLHQRRELKNNPILNPVKFYDVDFSAGNGVDFIDDIQTIQPSYVMDVPEFNGCTAFRSFGKSMEPLIDAGAILFATKDESWTDYIEYGQIYGIVCNNKRRFLKYIQKSIKVGHILLRSENKEFDTFDLPMQTIKSIWLINGWINKRV